MVEIRKIERGLNIRLNMIIYGRTGVGKTTLLGTADRCEDTAPALLVDVEGGALSLMGSDIDIVRPRDFSDIQDIYDFLAYENTEYRSVCIDSLTEIQRKLSMGQIIGELDADGESARYGNLATTTPPDRYDWLSSGEQMRRFIRAFRDLAYHPEQERRVHVIFTALEKADEARGVVCPSLPGLLGVEVGASVDVLGRLSVQTVIVGDEEDESNLRHLALQETEDPNGIHYLAKLRAPRASRAPKELWNPTVADILSIWKRRQRRRKRTK